MSRETSCKLTKLLPVVKYQSAISAQLLMTLRRSGLVRSQRGAKGGYLLAREPRQITLLEVLACLEGTKNLEPEGQTSPTPENSVLEEVWQKANTAAIAVLQRYTLEDLCEKRDERRRSNDMYYI
jgi:Rrf2 family protein